MQKVGAAIHGRSCVLPIAILPVRLLDPKPLGQAAIVAGVLPMEFDVCDFAGTK